MSWNAQGKCCASCAYWMGERKSPLRGMPWQVEHPSDRGKCAKNVFCGVTSGPCACEGRNCKEYMNLPTDFRH